MSIILMARWRYFSNHSSWQSARCHLDFIVALTNVLVRKQGKRYTHTLLVGQQIGVASLENSMEIPWKAGN
ncbi:hypothetical protein V4Y02_23415, partial [Escherichia coli]